MFGRQHPAITSTSAPDMLMPPAAAQASAAEPTLETIRYGLIVTCVCELAAQPATEPSFVETMFGNGELDPQPIAADPPPEFAR